ncbi:MAG: MipA/OmpV family protein [Proteobacteria bacterium]|nr:MipA/OmpV family protein [Pseudomonadota bacterium]
MGRLVQLGCALTAGLCLVSSAALADDTSGGPLEPPKGLHGRVNVGGAFVPDYEGSEDYQPVPTISGQLAYDEFYIEARGPTLRANVMPKILPFGLEFGPSLGYRFGRDDVKNDQVDALRDVDGSVAAGAFAKIYTNGLLQEGDELAFEVEGLTGVGTERNGTLIQFGPSYRFSPFERMQMGFRASATWADDRYNETFFSVDDINSARSGLSIYDAKGGLNNVGLSTNLSYMLNENWGVSATVGVTKLVGDAADSPIVDDAGSDIQGLATLGVVYSF